MSVRSSQASIRPSYSLSARQLVADAEASSASAASASGDGVHPMPGVEAVEVWSRTLDYQHGPELVRVYELRPYTPSPV